ncbi:hypothetical protein NDU88_005933 [Pleurodeles waltl]|uniref:Uncharacterized protein n=1 Tax=Pleurodeles waltl TaxID=8319 RepID=A0AAV7PKZ3_PLEWA|nr:hypothetical protein NDU88_005933 [Pleurodeles waltl]
MENEETEKPTHLCQDVQKCLQGPLPRHPAAPQSGSTGPYAQEGSPPLQGLSGTQRHTFLPRRRSLEHAASPVQQAQQQDKPLGPQAIPEASPASWPPVPALILTSLSPLMAAIQL